MKDATRETREKRPAYARSRRNSRLRGMRSKAPLTSIVRSPATLPFPGAYLDVADEHGGKIGSTALRHRAALTQA